MKKNNCIFLLVLFITSHLFGQEEDKSKMIREVIAVEVERPPKVETPKTETTSTDKKGKKKDQEEPPAEEVIDTLSPTIPAPATELKKRAEAWYNIKNQKFSKSGGAIGASAVNCMVNFYFKPKELNPKYDTEGEITMNVSIDWKEGKYRYTIDKIEHKAKRGVSTGGNIYEVIPACGSMKLDDIVWKQIKSVALENAKIVANDIKSNMSKSPKTENKDDW